MVKASNVSVPSHAIANRADVVRLLGETREIQTARERVEEPADEAALAAAA